MIAFRIVVVLVALHAVGCDRQPFSYQYVKREYDEFFIEDEATRFLCLAFALCVVDPGYGQKPELSTVYEWKQLEFDYSNGAARQAAIEDGSFIPGTPAPIDVDVCYSNQQNKKNRVFVTVPRFQPGIPVTLGVVTERMLDNNPIIKPYPSWDWHTNPQGCRKNRIVSVYRVMIDECQRLWVLDTGRLNETQVCPPQIMAFDLATDQLIHRYEIPSSQIESRSILVTPVVDIRDAHDKCRDTFVYVADCQTYSIIVYDVQNDISWRVTDKTMYPFPTYGTFSILGDSFDLMDGVLGMALSPFKPGEDRILYYHAMSSPTENYVRTSDLRNRSRIIHESAPEIFHTYKGERRTQSAAEAIDKDGIMYYGLMSDVTINCWNTRTEYGPPNTEPVARNRQTLQFPSGVKVITNTRAIQELWTMTSRFQKVAAGTLSTSEVNFRILAGKVSDLTSGTVCKRPGRPGRPGGGYGLIKPVQKNYLNA